MGEKGKTPLGFEYDLEFPDTYTEAWAKDDLLWAEQNPEEAAQRKKDEANAKRRKARADKKAAEEAAKRAEEEAAKPKPEPEPREENPRQVEFLERVGARLGAHKLTDEEKVEWEELFLKPALVAAGKQWQA